MTLSSNTEKMLEELLEGNRRFYNGGALHPHISAERRREVASGQHPFAVVLACSDSRVPPEVLFDRGLGDLFVVRTAGNVLDDAALGSIYYAVAHLGVRLVIVLGHSRCGAVGAVLEDGGMEERMEVIERAIAPAVEEARLREGDTHDLAARRNVELTVEMLRSSEPLLAPLAGELGIIGCYYDLDTGRIEIIC